MPVNVFRPNNKNQNSVLSCVMAQYFPLSFRMSCSSGKTIHYWISGFRIPPDPADFSFNSDSHDFMSLPQLIQTVSAVDQDDPHNGQHFYYSLAPEAANNPNFTVRDNQGNRVDRRLSMLFYRLGWILSVTIPCKQPSKVTCPLVAVKTLMLICNVFKSFVLTDERQRMSSADSETFS